MENIIYICSKEYKEKLLKNSDSILNIKFYTLKSFIDNLYFTYDDKSIYYLMDKYNFSYDTAVEYLDNLIYIYDYDSLTNKISFLKNIYNELNENNLIIFNEPFKDYITYKKVIVKEINLTKFDKFLLRNVDYKVELKDEKYIPSVYKFKYEEDEIDFVAYKISELISRGITLDKIKLTNISSDTFLKLKEIFSLYNLKVTNQNKINLLSLVIAKTFYDNLNLGIDAALLSIKEYEGSDIYNKIIDIINEYASFIGESKIIMIKEKLKRTSINSEKYSNEIEIVNFNTYSFSNDEYVFMLSFNEGVIPVSYKDTDYLNDSIKPIYLDNTFEKNIYEKNACLSVIKSIKNLIITYKENDDFKSYYPSSLLDELKVEVKTYEKNNLVSFSELKNKIDLINYIDNYIKFGSIHKDMNLLFNNFDISYNNYNHSFKAFSKEKINNYIKSKDEYELSYSSLDSYNRCNFRFYLEKILNLREPKQKFSVYFGSIYHYILEKAVFYKVDIQKEINDYIKNNNITLTNADKFFLEKSIKDIEFLLNVLKKQNSSCLLTNIETEKNIKIPIKNNIVFTGFIDKILTKIENGITYASVIDYKTYVKKPSLKYLSYGFDNQLFIYMYLVKKIYTNAVFVGFYLQNITLDNKSVEEKEKSLKLNGFSNIDKNILKYIDYDFEEGNVLEGVKVKNDGEFTSYSLKKLLSNEKIEETINITEGVINKSIDSILDGNFAINPKFDKTLIGCEFCPFRDICYKKEYDIVYLNIKDGDESGMD